MQYLKREMEQKFMRMSEFFPAVLVTGARQVGKTTMLRHLAEGQRRTYVTMDDLMARNLAQSDPALFFQTYRPPILLDEIQKAPELFEQIKIICDENGEKGQFWLTGSQQYRMMSGVRESLAGRIGIMEMYSLTKNEVEGCHFDEETDFSFSSLQGRQRLVKRNNIIDVFEHIWRGGMPAVLLADGEQRREYFRSYVETYLMRDVSEEGGITDAARFSKFLGACAALVGEQVNYKTLAETAGISQPTAKEWLYLLQGMGIVCLLAPYSNNALKRLAKTPKLYFWDTGLAASFSAWPTRDTLMRGAASGHYFENYVVTEMQKNAAYSGRQAQFSYYRDSNAKEIDLLAEIDGVIHPLEIKLSATPDRREVKKFDVLEKANLPVGDGGIICMCEESVPIDAKNCFIPCNLV